MLNAIKSLRLCIGWRTCQGPAQSHRFECAGVKFQAVIAFQSELCDAATLRRISSIRVNLLGATSQPSDCIDRSLRHLRHLRQPSSSLPVVPAARTQHVPSAPANETQQQRPLSLCSLLLFHSCGWTKPSQRAMRGIMAALRDFPANRTQLERRRRRIDAPPYSMPAPSGRWRSSRGGGGKEEGKS